MMVDATPSPSVRQLIGEVRAPQLTENDEAYLRLLIEFCAQADIDNPESILAGEEFNFDRVDFRFRVDEDKAPGVLNVWCDFSTVSMNDRLACYRVLLEQDVYYDGAFSSTMAVCPETGIILCCARVALGEVSGSQLKDYLRHLAREAQSWRQSTHSHDLKNNGRAAIGRAAVGRPAVGHDDERASSSTPVTDIEDALIVLLLSYCHSVGLAADTVEHLLLGIPLLVDGVPMVLHKNHDSPQGVHSLYCDYGKLPERHCSVDFYHTLLTANLLMFPAWGRSMLIANASGHLLLRHDFVTLEMNVETLSSLMADLAKQVAWWRSGDF